MTLDIRIPKPKGKKLINKKRSISSEIHYGSPTAPIGETSWESGKNIFKISQSQKKKCDGQEPVGKSEDISSVYIAGPMTGYKNYNYDEFNKAAATWRQRGWKVYNPAETDNGSSGKARDYYLRHDLVSLSQAEAIAYLPGWEKSKGATMEDHIAKELGLARYNAITFEAMTDEGRKDDNSKSRYDLIPSGPLENLAAVYTFGAKKYADRNWEKGIRWGRVFGAIMRHMWAFWKGEDNDPETGLPHPAHAAWGCFALLEYMNTHRDKDDRTS